MPTFLSKKKLTVCKFWPYMHPQSPISCTSHSPVSSSPASVDQDSRLAIIHRVSSSVARRGQLSRLSSLIPLAHATRIQQEQVAGAGKLGHWSSPSSIRSERAVVHKLAQARREATTAPSRVTTARHHRTSKKVRLDVVSCFLFSFTINLIFIYN